MKSPIFVIVDNYGTQNNGVMAMGVALVTQLREKVRDARCIFFSPPRYEAIDRARYAPFDIEVKQLFWCPSVRLGRLKDPIWFLVSLLFCAVYKYLPDRFVKQEFRVFKNSDVVISLCGEDLLSDYCSWRLILRQLFSFLAAKIFRKPYVIFAQTIGPLIKRLEGHYFA